MLHKMFQVDAFTDQLFSGNPAAVFVVEEFYSDHLMQAIAAENNLAETAFVVPRDNSFDLRWFTPTHEVAFCGHATLAAAHTLITEYDYQGTLIFQTKEVGPLKVTSTLDNTYRLDLPRLDPQPVNTDLSSALGVKPKDVFRNFENLFAVLETEQHVRDLVPDLHKLAAVDAGGVCVTAAASDAGSTDFVSRYFAPKAGIPEDPVTGSTHATLTPYWARTLHKKNLLARQCSVRGGVLHCELGDERVWISGQAVTYLEAWVRLPENAR